MEELLNRIRDPRSSLAEVIQEFLRIAGKDITNDRRKWLECELNGYEEAIEYYLRPPVNKFDSGFIPFERGAGRETPGRIKLMRSDGEHADLHHAFASREYFFVSLPIRRIEGLVQQDGDTSLVELPELSKFICDRIDERVFLSAKKSEMQRILDGVRRNTAWIIDFALHPEKEQQMHEALEQRRRNRGLKG
jgi:hypothetical protein